ncbi:hypothetical protein [Polynucleobacter nymphae]|uniref:hypothetical protein n=1 Tax=Polynucleobacter nymphae TaxID=2081043 RepID=UPI001C0AFDC0|nr:hypothetical protein [Polynucleobacter nymphae]MBU3607307.1 hypothetical protein [Polynucleobacter nymphae]
MTGVMLELVIEFGVILISPIVFHYYLWKYKKIAPAVILKDFKIYAGLYGLILITGIFAIWGQH